VGGSRERILERLRAGRPRDARAEEVAARLARPEPNLIPARARRQQPELVELIGEMAEEAAASVARVERLEAVPAAAARWLAEHASGSPAVVPPASPLHDLDWGGAGVEVASRSALSGDAAAVGTAYAGIAETGTLVLCSGPENPVTHAFLPESQLVVLRACDVVGPPEDVWARLREQGGALPRTVNWITGPSRSGDIELTMLMGAHGPVRVHVLLVAGPHGPDSAAGPG